MKRFVLDASIALAWVLDVPIPKEALQVRKELATGRRALVPCLWHLEVANGLLMAERRRYLTGNDVDQALTQIERTVLGAVDTEPSFALLQESLAAARKFQLTAYDAIYLELSRREGLPLATLDRALSAAAAKAGVTLVC